jgi:hypothetical protein
LQYPIGEDIICLNDDKKIIIKNKTKKMITHIVELEFFLLSRPMSAVADFSISSRVTSPSTVIAEGFFSHSPVF